VLRADGITGKQGKLVETGYVYWLLNDRVYIGQAGIRAPRVPASTTPSSAALAKT
jgi:hypothetical protein